jgi:hypothetical protein
MSEPRAALEALGAALDRRGVRAYGGPGLTALAEALPRTVLATGPEGTVILAGQARLGWLRPFGSLVACVPGPAADPPRRLVELDRHGTVTVLARREPGGTLARVAVRGGDAGWTEIRVGGAQHPLWGPSDPIAWLPDLTAPDGEILTVCGRVRWEAVDSIPPLADPTRLPPGAGSAILNWLASLAADQGARSLRYRGPYPTEQLFWSLTESFRVDSAPDALDRFLAGAEATFIAGEPREVPVDWVPAPHERVFEPGGVCVQLRDGVEKVTWGGRSYHRTAWQGLTRREHRVVRPVGGDGDRVRYVVGLEALGRPVEEHLELDAAGRLVGRHPSAADAEVDEELPLDGLWTAALGVLVPLEATPLLAPAIAAVWPDIRLTWGPVERDLVTARGSTIRLSPRLVRRYRALHAGAPADGRRALARSLVQDVLGLVGPSVRQAAAAWLDGHSPDRKAEILQSAGRHDRTAAALDAAKLLNRLLAALEAAEGLPGAPDLASP